MIKFTSHYVSINSIKEGFWVNVETKFTSHYVSINSSALNYNYCIVTLFTSHYVSINSKQVLKMKLTLLNLHPTMYLLIRNMEVATTQINPDLHPTMYLLIHEAVSFTSNHIYKFTSHYVSINSQFRYYNIFLLHQFTSHYVSINSRRLSGSFLL